MKPKKESPLIINISVNNINDCYSQFYDKKNMSLSEDFVQYIYDNIKTKRIKKYSKIEIELDLTNKVNEDELQLFKKSFSNHFNNLKIFNQIGLKRFNFFAMGLLSLGIIVLLIIGLLDYYLNLQYIIYTVLEIMAWVFVWEFVDVFFFKRFENKINYKLNHMLSDAVLTIK